MPEFVEIDGAFFFEILIISFFAKGNQRYPTSVYINRERVISSSRGMSPHSGDTQQRRPVDLASMRQRRVKKQGGEGRGRGRGPGRISAHVRLSVETPREIGSPAIGLVWAAKTTPASEMAVVEHPTCREGL